MTSLCFCGKPLHYSNPDAEEYMHALVRALGPEIMVRVGRRAFMVPRHYIALHGLKGAEVDKMGFVEVI